jgi:hypothetical protein
VTALLKLTRLILDKDTSVNETQDCGGGVVKTRAETVCRWGAKHGLKDVALS